MVQVHLERPADPGEHEAESNKRVAEQIEAARRTALAKGEVGIRDKKPVPTLAAFIAADFALVARAAA